MCFAFVFLSLSTLFGTVRGIVHDPQHRPVPGANVVVQALHSQFSISGQSNASGEFEFPRVPVGEYTVTATETGFKPASVAVTVQSNEAPILHLELALATASQTTTVEATAGVVDVQSSTPTTMIGQEQINRTPGANRSNSLAMITDYVPGAYMVHDQLHLRGGHQVSWLVDGVPVPNTNIASNVGPQFDPKDIESLDALRGSYDAEFGDR
ncbi:MAG TPA: carboxypeptidase regulatory-like domain-containing protein, partial [Terriglobales bacterium]